MVEFVKKHLMAKSPSKKNKRKSDRLDRFGEDLANGQLMAVLSGIYSVDTL